MTLAKLLSKIADTNDITEREKLRKEFVARVSGHKEEKLLMSCLASAWTGRRKYISFGRNIWPPAELWKEGFHLEPEGSSFNYCFD